MILLYTENRLIRIFVEKFFKSASEPLSTQKWENKIELEFIEISFHEADQINLASNTVQCQVLVISGV